VRHLRAREPQGPARAIVGSFTPGPAHQGYRGLMSGGLLAAVARLAGGAVAAESRAIYVEIPRSRLPGGGG
jgi:hypothetical protein